MEESTSRHFIHGSPSDFESIAADYEITGGSILNVLQLLLNRIAAQRGDRTKSKKDDILKGIKKEFLKEGITL